MLYAQLLQPVIPMSTILHELGHNVGLNHAAVYGSGWPNGTDQGDTSAIM